MSNADNKQKFFHLNAANEMVFAGESTMAEALELAHKWNKGEKRPGMKVELVSSSRKAADALRLAAV